jgi:hypothetical protein
MTDNFNLEISRFSLDILDFARCYDIYIQMPADLDQFRGDNSHRAVIGGECLVKLRHHPAYRRGFLEKINIIPGIGQIESRLHSGNPASHNQH